MAKKRADIAADAVETLLANVIEAGPQKKPITGHFEINELLKQQKTLAASEDMHVRVSGMRLASKIKTAVIRALYGSGDPKDMPMHHMRHALENPISENFVNPLQRKSIDGPLRGIRVFCLECQGGDPALVRECAAINCPLWAFRMSANPFFGRLSDADADAESDETDADMEALKEPTHGV